MNLTVIIVSYNVRHFLEQCLKSVIRASNTLDVDIIVVDNGSEDDSVEMVQALFPRVTLIVNLDNRGFSKANNQAIRQSESDYILLLNPDTVIEETTLICVLGFMENHPEAGGLGIKMIDGKGHFLPESKRGLPTPWASFCKMSYLSKLFPRSEFFNRYYLGFLSENKISKVAVLAGAFMLLRRKVLDEIGLLDEDFFMYGEDIDLSFRITQAGYINYYFPEARMIHYKGESTRMSSINYVRLFYGAMLIFARKHFVGKNKRLLSLVILPGVYFRALIAMIYRLLNSFSHFSSLVFFSKDKFKTQESIINRVALVIANQDEVKKILNLLDLVSSSIGICYTVSDINEGRGPLFSFETIKGKSLLTEIQDRINHIHPDEIIFSSSDMTTDLIITMMDLLKDQSIPFRIAHTDNNAIIGTNFVCVLPETKVNV
jgi:GT2 family glycosyltransferase